jgi:hypothetical protein
VEGDFPDRIGIGTQAIREFDEDDKAFRLVQLLNKFGKFYNVA